MSKAKSPKLIPLSPVPLYNQLKEILRGQILDGTWPPLSRMPSENELGQRFDVSRITVRQALNDLQKEGLIFKIHGKGTFVAKPKAFQNVSTLQGLAESLGRQGYEVINRLISFKTIAASSQVAQRLNIKEGSQVSEIKRLRLVNREPVSLEVTWLPLDIGQQLEKAELAIDAILAESELTRLLKIEEGSPIMRIERLTHTDDGTPIDYEYLYYRGDAFQYRLRIDRHRSDPGEKS